MAAIPQPPSDFNLPHDDESTYIHFLDVGQGDGTLIITPNWNIILVDLGSIKNANSAGNDAVQFIINTLFFRANNVRGFENNFNIQHLLITHPDRDHYMLIPVLESALLSKANIGLQVDNVYIGQDTSNYPQWLFRKVNVSKNAVNTFPADTFNDPASPLLDIDGIQFHLLSANHPGGGGHTASNSSSLVLRIHFAGLTVILTGDAEANVEATIRSKYDSNFLKCDILKLGHHGSKNATSLKWIETTQPNLVFASADRKWSHPYLEVFERFLKDKSKGFNKENIEHLVQIGGNHTFAAGTAPQEDYQIIETDLGIFTNLIGITDGGIVYGVQYLAQLLRGRQVFISAIGIKENEEEFSQQFGPLQLKPSATN